MQYSINLHYFTKGCATDCTVSVRTCKIKETFFAFSVYQMKILMLLSLVLPCTTAPTTPQTEPEITMTTPSHSWVTSPSVQPTEPPATPLIESGTKTNSSTPRWASPCGFGHVTLVSLNPANVKLLHKGSSRTTSIAENLMIIQSKARQLKFKVSTFQKIYVSNVNFNMFYVTIFSHNYHRAFFHFWLH